MSHEIQPFQLQNVPVELRWCIYKKELRRGNVRCYPAAYLLALALRWMLSYTDEGYCGRRFESWKVHWKMDDDYGFRTRIFLVRDKVEDYDPESQDWFIQQQPVSCHLATLNCHDGSGHITEVIMRGSPPYGGYVTMDAHTGVRRLLDDAAHSSIATHSWHPIRRSGDTTRVLRNAHGIAMELVYTLKTTSTGHVSGICLAVEEQPPWLV